MLQTIPFLDVAVEVSWLMLGSQLLSVTAVSQCTLRLGPLKSWAKFWSCILAVQQIANSVC